MRSSILAVLSLLATLAAVAPAHAAVRIDVVSSRADLVTGGDALVAVHAPRGRRLRVSLNGRAVTAAFDRSARPALGLVTGLRRGRNVLVARARGQEARLRIVNGPVGGPLFAGPQVQPWRCLTEENGLGPPLDAQCNAAAPVVSYLYSDRTTGMLMPYDPAAPPPADAIAETTTDDGRTVPYIVRKERGTLDRSIYELAVLAQPDGEPVWNGKLFVPFGGSCSTRHSQAPPGGIEVSQTAPDSTVALDRQLSRGFAVATTGLSTLGQNCNTVVSAEALAMLSERVSEVFGRPIRYTIGEGCSGGSVMQHTIADTYPGLLDGIIPSCSFPDLWSPVTELGDCTLLNHYFNAVSPALWLDPLARAAASGLQTPVNCPAFELAFAGVLRPADRGSPTTACDVPDAQQYHPRDNPTGVRCAIQDYSVAVWGRRGDGFARRPLDNVGVQYGLEALRAGQIGAEQFVDLNEKIGGLDIDGNPAPARMRAGRHVVRTAYRANQIVRGRNLARVPIIDLRGTGNAEIHTDHWSYATRARLRAANGTADNQVIWTTLTDTFVTVGRHPPLSPGEAAFVTMDRWLEAIEADPSRRSLPAKVIANKPADAVDACYAPNRITDRETCAQLYPHYGNPRTAAGGPVSADVVKCGLAPLDRSSYGVPFSDGQWERLNGAFPSGVCDYARTPAPPEPLTWPTFARGPGGRPLGPAPRSRQVR